MLIAGRHVCDARPPPKVEPVYCMGNELIIEYPISPKQVLKDGHEQPEGPVWPDISDDLKFPERKSITLETFTTLFMPTLEDCIGASSSDPRKLFKKYHEYTSIVLEQTKQKFAELHKQLESAKNEIIACKICCIKPRQVVFYPCTHVVSCNDCHSQLLKCPICRTIIDHRYKVVIS